jgi:hypothetical protein
MLALTTEPTIVQPEPPRSSISMHDNWKQQIWGLAQSLDVNANAVLVQIDSKRKTKQPAELRKRWAEMRKCCRGPLHPTVAPMAGFGFPYKMTTRMILEM